jgi:hypothetical protein
MSSISKRPKFILILPAYDGPKFHVSTLVRGCTTETPPLEPSEPSNFLSIYVFEIVGRYIFNIILAVKSNMHQYRLPTEPPP